MTVKACSQCGRPALAGTTRCANHPKRWSSGSTRAWRTQRARILQRDPTCWCGQPATEVHHLNPGSSAVTHDSELRGVCHQHNPRGG